MLGYTSSGAEAAERRDQIEHWGAFVSALNAPADGSQGISWRQMSSWAREHQGALAIAAAAITLLALLRRQ